MKNKKDRHSKINWRVVAYSIAGLGCVALGFFVNYIFFLGAVVFMILNQRELFGKK